MQLVMLQIYEKIQMKVVKIQTIYLVFIFDSKTGSEKSLERMVVIKIGHQD